MDEIQHLPLIKRNHFSLVCARVYVNSFSHGDANKVILRWNKNGTGEEEIEEEEEARWGLNQPK